MLEVELHGLLLYTISSVEAFLEAMEGVEADNAQFREAVKRLNAHYGQLLRSEFEGGKAEALQAFYAFREYILNSSELAESSQKWREYLIEYWDIHWVRRGTE